jgi:hypothetical protein
MSKPEAAEAIRETADSKGKEWRGIWADDDATRREQFKLIYDYIKFHIGLYLSTPAVIGLLGNTFGVLNKPAFQISLTAMIGLYLIAGVHAGWFMGNHVNKPWDRNYLPDFADAAFDSRRRFFHHWLYWLGLAVGLGGLLYAKRWG